MDFNEQITILQENIRMSQGRRDSKIRFVTADKWRSIMMRCIQKMKKKEIYDANLLDDMQLIVQSVKEAKFIQAILNIQPFRPNFLLKKRQSRYKDQVQNIEEYDNYKSKTKLSNTSSFEYRNSIIKLKRSVNEKINQSLQQTNSKHKKSLLQEMICYVTEEQTLTKQFEKKYHPFRKIIQHYLYVIQNKYKAIIEHQDVVKIESIQETLIIDIKLFQQFIVKSSEPYITLFKTQNQEQKAEFQVKMVAFLKQYIEKHQKINALIRKIMRMASRKTSLIRNLSIKVPDFVQVNNFDIKDIYKIDGCYIQSMNALMEFAESPNSKFSLKKLKQFRSCMSKDVDDYYLHHQSPPTQREISTEMQIEIIKFILAKLKSFICQIFAQLKFLEVVYGQSDMSFKYDDSSYMYAQISVALQALELQYQ